MKATHFGECQLCGSIQKLPNGRLAKHGYRVLDSFFTGVCPGSNGLPYEQSFDLMEDAIQRTQNRIADLNLEILANQNETTPLLAYVYVNDHRFPGYRWIAPIEISETGRIRYVKNERTIETPPVSGIYTREAMTMYCRDQRIKFLEKLVRQGEQYITICQNRITNWTLKKLQPIAQ